MLRVMDLWFQKTVSLSKHAPPCICVIGQNVICKY